MKNAARLLAAMVGVGAATSAAAAGVVSVELEGTGKKGAALAAQVEVDVTSPHQAWLSLHNASEEVEAPGNKGKKGKKGKGGGDDAPRLRRIGFNLGGDVPVSCLEVIGTSEWALAKKAKPFCASNGWGSGGCAGQGKNDAALFDVELRAKHAGGGWGGVGLAPGETAVIGLRVKSSCQAAVQLTAESFWSAETSKSGGVGAQWAARFVGGGSGGCAQGGADEPAPVCQAEFTWGELVATTADLNGNPSLLQASDLRAGSFIYQFNGSVGFDPTGATTDAPYSAASATLRAGDGTLLEQWHVNRRWPGGDGCSSALGYPRCWVDVSDYPGEVVSFEVPTFAASSNDGFDDSGMRAEVSADVLMDFSVIADGEALEDNSHETIVVRWHAPLGIDTAQLLLRGRYDDEANGLNSDDPFVILFSRNVYGLVDGQIAGVEIIEETELDLVIAITAEAGVQGVCQAEAPAP